ncbi:hypothetical protein CYJ36_04365 [Bacillus sp. UMB0893]|nr:hypothetical protein CYJ36_04365 [Bacillus sp. UMB0893]
MKITLEFFAEHANCKQRRFIHVTNFERIDGFRLSKRVVPRENLLVPYGDEKVFCVFLFNNRFLNDCFLGKKSAWR